MSPKSLDAALLAAGGLIATVDAVFAGRVSNAFAIVRPLVHHATPAKGMGFSGEAAGMAWPVNTVIVVVQVSSNRRPARLP